jgi:hypothetical protein
MNRMSLLTGCLLLASWPSACTTHLGNNQPQVHLGGPYKCSNPCAVVCTDLTSVSSCTSNRILIILQPPEASRPLAEFQTGPYHGISERGRSRNKRNRNEGFILSWSPGKAFFTLLPREASFWRLRARLACVQLEVCFSNVIK